MEGPQPLLVARQAARGLDTSQEQQHDRSHSGEHTSTSVGVFELIDKSVRDCLLLSCKQPRVWGLTCLLAMSGHTAFSLSGCAILFACHRQTVHCYTLVLQHVHCTSMAAFAQSPQVVIAPPCASFQRLEDRMQPAAFGCPSMDWIGHEMVMRSCSMQSGAVCMTFYCVTGCNAASGQAPQLACTTCISGGVRVILQQRGYVSLKPTTMQACTWSHSFTGCSKTCSGVRNQWDLSLQTPCTCFHQDHSWRMLYPRFCCCAAAHAPLCQC